MPTIMLAQRLTASAASNRASPRRSVTDFSRFICTQRDGPGRLIVRCKPKLASDVETMSHAHTVFDLVSQRPIERNHALICRTNL
jgi:hypothetical protein